MTTFPIGTCVRFIVDYDDNFMRFDLQQLLRAFGVIQRVASYDQYGARYEVLWRWPGCDETSVSFHGERSLKTASPLEALACVSE